MKLLFFGFALFWMYVRCKEHGGFSYHKFYGPVSGEVEEVRISDNNGHRTDYRAKPDYAYSYGVLDPINGNNHEHQESRDGDAVQGQYRVLQADGTTRVVKYTADSTNGFQAVVEYH